MSIPRDVVAKMNGLAEKFFGTASDPDQIPITMESWDKLQALHPKTIVYTEAEGQPISWVVVLPTTKDLMDRFLAGEISEKDLLDKTQPADYYQALYLCAAFTVPERRRQGLAMKQFKQAIEGISTKGQAALFAWPFSDEGRSMLKRAQAELGQTILIRKS